MKRLCIASIYVLMTILCCCRNSAYLSREELISSYIYNCRNKWQFKDLNQPIRIKVKLFQPWYRIDLYVLPSVIIGLDSNNTLVSVLDREFQDIIVKEDEYLMVYPQKWTVKEKQHPQIMAFNHKNDYYNRLSCEVKDSYYGKIEKVK